MSSRVCFACVRVGTRVCFACVRACGYSRVLACVRVGTRVCFACVRVGTRARDHSLAGKHTQVTRVFFFSTYSWAVLYVHT